MSHTFGCLDLPLRSTSETLKADGKLRVSLTQIIVVFLNLAPLHGLDGWLSSSSPGSYVNMTLCSLCPLPSLRTSVDLLITVWLVDEHSNVPSRTMVSVTMLHGLTLHTLTSTHTHAQDKHMHPFTPPSPDPLHDVVLYTCCFFVLRFFCNLKLYPAKDKV
ncbi:hypothetical protein ILYODFUR_038482 [Ilyodon furcidens]|uniref:Uncharacterized protein n=1 Tax=Ilyodon furcidens TaxID=33524 RepID=A0ABV0UBX3_9TELE